MSPCRGKEYLVVAKNNFSGWLEVRALRSANSEAVAQFLWEDVICRYDYFERLIIDESPKNKRYTDEFTKKYGIKRVVLSVYYL